MTVEMFFDSIVQSSASGMAHCDGLMAENEYSLFERMQDNEQWIVVDGAEIKAVVFVEEKDPLPLLKRATDVVTECVVISGGYRFF